MEIGDISMRLALDMGDVLGQLARFSGAVDEAFTAPSTSAVTGAFEVVGRAAEDTASTVGGIDLTLPTPDVSNVTDAVNSVATSLDSLQETASGLDLSIPPIDTSDPIDSLKNLEGEFTSLEGVASGLDLTLPVMDTSAASGSLQTLEGEFSTLQSDASSLNLTLPPLDTSSADGSLKDLEGEFSTLQDDASGLDLTLPALDTSGADNSLKDLEGEFSTLQDDASGLDLTLPAPDTSAVDTALSGLGPEAEASLQEMEAAFADAPPPQFDVSGIEDSLKSIGTTAETEKVPLDDFGNSIDDLKPKATGALGALQDLADKFRDGEITVKEYIAGANAIADAFKKAGDDAANGGEGVNKFSIFLRQFISDQEDATSALDKAKIVLAEAQAAYAQGAIDADTLARVQEHVATAFKDANPAIEQTKTAMDNATASTNALKEVLGALGVALSLGAFVGFVKDIGEAYDSLTKADIALTKVTGDANIANDILERLDKLGLSDGLSLPGLEKAATAMAAILPAGTDVVGTLSELADASAVSGKSVEALASIFDRVAESGKLNARALKDFGLNITDLKGTFSDLGISLDKFSGDAIKAFNSLSENDQIVVLQTALLKLQGTAEDVANNTFTGAWGRAAAQFDVDIKLIIKDYGDLTGKIPDLTPVVNRVAIVFVALGGTIKAVVDNIVNNVVALQVQLQGVGKAASDALSGNFEQAGRDISDAMATAAQVSAKAASDWKADLDSMKKAISDLEDQSKTSTTVISNDLDGAGKHVKEAADKASAAFHDYAGALREFHDISGTVITDEEKLADKQDALKTKIGATAESIGHAEQNLHDWSQRLRDAKTDLDNGVGSLGAYEEAQKQVDTWAAQLEKDQKAHNKALEDFDRASGVAQTAASGLNEFLSQLAGTSLAAGDDINGLGIDINNLAIKAPDISPLNQAVIDLGSSAAASETPVKDLLTDIENLARDSQTSWDDMTTYVGNFDKAMANLAKTDLPLAVSTMGQMVDKLIAAKAPTDFLNTVTGTYQGLINKLAKEDLPAAISAEQNLLDKDIARHAPMTQLATDYKDLDALQVKLDQDGITVAEHQHTSASQFITDLALMKQKAEDAHDSFRNLGGNLAADFTKVWGDAWKTFGNGLADAITGSKSFGDAMMGVLKSIEKEIANVLIGDVIKSLRSSLDGLAGTIGGLFKDLGTSIGGLTGSFNSAADAIGLVTVAAGTLAIAVDALSVAFEKQASASQQASFFSSAGYGPQQVQNLSNTLGVNFSGVPGLTDALNKIIGTLTDGKASAQQIADAALNQQKIIADLQSQQADLLQKIIAAEAVGSQDSQNYANSLKAQFDNLGTEISADQTILKLIQSATGATATNTTGLSGVVATQEQTTAAVNNLEGSLTSLRSQAADLEQQIITAEASNNTALVASLTSQLGIVNTAITSQQTTLDGINTSVKNTSPAVVAATKALQDAITSGDISAISKSTTDLRTALGDNATQIASAEKEVSDAIVSGNTAALTKGLDDLQKALDAQQQQTTTAVVNGFSGLKASDDQIATAMSNAQASVDSLKGQLADLNEQLILAEAGGNSTLVSAIQAKIGETNTLLGTANSTLTQIQSVIAPVAALNLSSGAQASGTQGASALANLTSAIAGLKAQESDLNQQLIIALANGDIDLAGRIQAAIGGLQSKISEDTTLLANVQKNVGGTGYASFQQIATAITNEQATIIGLNANLTKLQQEYLQALAAGNNDLAGVIQGQISSTNSELKSHTDLLNQLTQNTNPNTVAGAIASGSAAASGSGNGQRLGYDPSVQNAPYFVAPLIEPLIPIMENLLFTNTSFEANVEAVNKLLTTQAALKSDTTKDDKVKDLMAEMVEAQHLIAIATKEGNDQLLKQGQDALTSAKAALDALYPPATTTATNTGQSATNTGKVSDAILKMQAQVSTDLAAYQSALKTGIQSQIDAAYAVLAKDQASLDALLTPAKQTAANTDAILAQTLGGRNTDPSRPATDQTTTTTGAGGRPAAGATTTTPPSANTGPTAPTPGETAIQTTIQKLLDSLGSPTTQTATNTSTIASTIASLGGNSAEMLTTTQDARNRLNDILSVLNNFGTPLGAIRLDLDAIYPVLLNALQGGNLNQGFQDIVTAIDGLHFDHVEDLLSQIHTDMTTDLNALQVAEHGDSQTIVTAVTGLGGNLALVLGDTHLLVEGERNINTSVQAVTTAVGNLALPLGAIATAVDGLAADLVNIITAEGVTTTAVTGVGADVVTLGVDLQKAMSDSTATIIDTINTLPASIGKSFTDFVTTLSTSLDGVVTAIGEAASGQVGLLTKIETELKGAEGVLDRLKNILNELVTMDGHTDKQLTAANATLLAMPALISSNLAPRLSVLSDAIGKAILTLSGGGTLQDVAERIGDVGTYVIQGDGNIVTAITGLPSAFASAVSAALAGLPGEIANAIAGAVGGALGGISDAINAAIAGAAAGGAGTGTLAPVTGGRGTQTVGGQVPGRGGSAGGVPSYDTGGFVSEDTLAMVHAGEFIIPADVVQGMSTAQALTIDPTLDLQTQLDNFRAMLAAARQFAGDTSWGLDLAANEQLFGGNEAAAQAAYGSALAAQGQVNAILSLINKLEDMLGLPHVEGSPSSKPVTSVTGPSTSGAGSGTGGSGAGTGTGGSGAGTGTGPTNTSGTVTPTTITGGGAGPLTLPLQPPATKDIPSGLTMQPPAHTGTGTGADVPPGTGAGPSTIDTDKLGASSKDIADAEQAITDAITKLNVDTISGDQGLIAADEELLNAAKSQLTALLQQGDNSLSPSFPGGGPRAIGPPTPETSSGGPRAFGAPAVNYQALEIDAQNAMLTNALTWLSGTGASQHDADIAAATYRSDAAGLSLPHAKASGTGFSGYNPYGFPSFDMGGPVPQDMLAMVHRGEYVLDPDITSYLRRSMSFGDPLSLRTSPMAGAGGGPTIGQVTNQFNGITNFQQLAQMVGDIIKQYVPRTGSWSNG